MERLKQDYTLKIFPKENNFLCLGIRESSQGNELSAKIFRSRKTSFVPRIQVTGKETA